MLNSQLFQLLCNVKVWEGKNRFTFTVVNNPLCDDDAVNVSAHQVYTAAVFWATHTRILTGAKTAGLHKSLHCFLSNTHWIFMAGFIWIYWSFYIKMPLALCSHQSPIKEKKTSTRDMHFYFWTVFPPPTALQNRKAFDWIWFTY